MKFLGGVAVWLLSSCVRSKEHIIDNLGMFDKMDATLGLFERHFGESVTKKLSFAMFEGTQNMRSPLEILSNFVEELTPEETDSISQGIASAVEEVAQLLKQPEARELLSVAITSAPSLLSTLNSLSRGGKTDSKDAMVDDKYSDAFESKAQDKRKKKTILDYMGPVFTEEHKGEDVMDIPGGLLKTGASLLTSLGLSSNPKKSGGGLVGFATKILERLIEEGVMDEEFMKTFDEDDETDERETKPEELAGETPKEGSSQSKQPEPKSKSGGNRKNKDKINHSEL